jgi:DNA-binding response OmpR family regulator
VEYFDGSNEYADRALYPLPCLVLLDLNLPYRHGFEVLRWVRNKSDFRTLPVLVLTSSSADSDARKAYELGANAYVIKPSSPDKLREFVSGLKHFWLEWNYTPPNIGELSADSCAPLMLERSNVA